MARSKASAMKGKPVKPKSAPKTFEEAAEESIKAHRGALKRLAKL